MTRNKITETILTVLLTVLLIPAGAIFLTILWVVIQG
jgi:hypothetical protein